MVRPPPLAVTDWVRSIGGVQSVLQYGALADGVGNCSAAVAEAVAAMPDGGTLVFPPGEYRFAGSPIVVGDNITIIGHEALLEADGNQRIFDLSGTNIHLRWLRFDGQRSDADQSLRTNIVLIENAEDVWIEDCSFRNVSSSCVVFGSNVTGAWVVRNSCVDFNECAVDMVGSGLEAVYILDNRIKTSVVHPNAAVSRPIGISAEPQLAGVNSDIFIRGNSINFDGLSAANLSVSHGITFNQHSVPASAFVLKRCTVEGNHIRGGGTGIRFQAIRYGAATLAAHVVIRNNTIEHIRTHGIQVDGGDDTDHSDVLIVEGNSIFGWSEATANMYDGIHLSGNLAAPMVHGNRITRRITESGAANGRYGINISEATVLAAQVKSNYVANAQTGALNDSGTDTVEDFP